MGRLIYEIKEVETTIFSENSAINYKSTRRPTAKFVIVYSSLYISSYVWKFIYEGWQTLYYGDVMWNKITKRPLKFKENSRDLRFTNCSPYIFCLNTLEVKFFVFKRCVKQLLKTNNLFIVPEFVFATDFWRYGYCEFIFNVFWLILWFQQSLIFLYGRGF
jgi:hypothetical protein